MDLLKTPSVQSLLDSDLESVESLHCLDIEELDEVEYALPVSEAPSLAELLSSDNDNDSVAPNEPTEDPSCSSLQVDFLQAVSQQLGQAQERSSAGAATSLTIAIGGKLTVGTAHGQLLSFQDQILRWVCDKNSDKGSVSCLAYNSDGSRLLAGFARGLICQYETTQGLILRRVTLGGETWGILRVTWAGTSALALDTGGSVWLIKFSRPLGIRAARASCLFSGARGEVVAMAARDARILALATLSRIIIVAGGRAAGLKMSGPSDTMPVLTWCETDKHLLVCARANTLQWIAVDLNGVSISLRPIRRFEIKTAPLWLGWIGGALAILDADEKLHLWGEDNDKSLDLSHIEPVYASAFYKGLWTDGRVSRAMWQAGAGAVGGAAAAAGALALLGRRGVLRVRARDPQQRARALFAAARLPQALRLLQSVQREEARALAADFVERLVDKPSLLSDKKVADGIVKMCLTFDLSEELWTTLWERFEHEDFFVEAVGDAVVRGEAEGARLPSPAHSQALLERLADAEPALVERVLAALPLAALDPHRATLLARDRKLWRALGAVAAALDGSSGALRVLTQWTAAGCGASRCECAGDALLLLAADGLAGRAPAGRPLPAHARPSARHDALQTLLSEEGCEAGTTPLRALVRHDAAATARLLEQGWRDPPFVGPLGKQNRLRVARALGEYADDLQVESRIHILEFIAGQMSVGGLAAERALVAWCATVAAAADCERADRAALGLQRAGLLPDDLLPPRPRLLWRSAAPAAALDLFFDVDQPSPADLDELFAFLRRHLKAEPLLRAALHRHLGRLIRLRPAAAAALVEDDVSDAVTAAIRSEDDDAVMDFAEALLEAGALKGDAVAAYLRNLCVRRPSRVKEFLVNNPGIVRPEEALDIVTEVGLTEAKPMCLEAAGDPEGALSAYLDAISSCGDEAAAAELVDEACELCARASRSVPRAVAVEMWTRLLSAAGDVKPGALLDAVAVLPVPALLAFTPASRRAALCVLRAAAAERGAWLAAARVLQRDLHAGTARARRSAGRGVRAEAQCEACRAPLESRPPARVLHCAHRVLSLHAQCPGGCTRCPAPREMVGVPPRPAPPPPPWRLSLRAPPRPDLEGVV